MGIVTVLQIIFNGIIYQSLTTIFAMSAEENDPNLTGLSLNSHSSNASVEYSERLESFSDFPTSAPVNPIQLAKQGFVYNKFSPTSQSVTCSSCNKTVEKWNDGDKPGDPQFHQPGCRFIYDSASSLTSSSGRRNRAAIQQNEEEVTKPFHAPSSVNFQGQQIGRMAQSLVHAGEKAGTGPSRESVSLPATHTVHEITRVQRTELGERSMTNVETVRSLSHQESASSLHRERLTSPTPSFRSVQSSQFSYRPLSPVSLRSQSSIQETIPMSVNLPSTSRQESQWGPPSRLENPDTLEEVIAQCNMRVAEDRLYTFQRFWLADNEFRNVRLLATHGFYCLGHGDAVECFCCHVVIANWSRNDNPRSRHLELSPRCRFIKGEECGNVPLPPEVRRSRRTRVPSSSTSEYPSIQSQYSGRSQPRSAPPNLGPVSQRSIQRTGAGSYTSAMQERNNLMTAFPCDNPANPSMRDENVRLQTFVNSPFHQRTRLRASNKTLAMAGLYYTGEGDRVKCWFCDGGLKDFLPEDDPWVEHAKYFPQCEHLLQRKGPEWVTSVSIQFPYIRRPSLPPRERRVLPSVVSSPTPLPPPPTSLNNPQQREIMLEEGMQSEPVLLARQMGFSDDIIRAVQMQKIIDDGCCYQSSEQFVNAILYGSESDSLQQQPRRNVINMDGQTIHIHGGNFIGPSVINDQYFPPLSYDGVRYTNTFSTTTANPGSIYIGGVPLEEFMRDTFDHPFFCGETNNLISSRQPDVVFLNARRNIYTGSMNPTSRMVPSSLPTSSNTSDSSPNTPSTTESYIPSGSVEERLAALERERSCKVCLSSRSEILFQPCGHICACTSCSSRLALCPICRRRIVNKIQAYHS